MSISLKLERVKTVFRLIMTNESMLKVLARDNEEGASPEGKTLYCRLNELSYIQDIEYDGHFGPTVYYTFYVDEDQPMYHNEVAAIVRRYIERRDY